MKAVNLKQTDHALDALYVYETVGKLNGHMLSVVNVEKTHTGFSCA